MLPTTASIKCKDEKVYQLLQRVFRRVDQEDDLAKLGEAAKLRTFGHSHNCLAGRSSLGYRLRFPISDDRHLHIVILSADSDG